MSDTDSQASTYRGNRGRGRGRGNGSRGRGSGRGNWGRGRGQERQPNVTIQRAPNGYYWRANARPNEPDEGSCPFIAWEKYFPREEYTDDHELIPRIEAYTRFFNNNSDDLVNLDEVFTTGSVSLDYGELIEYDDPDAPTATDIRELPEVVLPCMGLAIHQVVAAMEDAIGERIPTIRPRLHNYDHVTPLRHMKSNYIGKYIAIQGTVVRVSNVRPLVTRIVFSCNTCGDTQIVVFNDGRFETPKKCYTPQCKGKMFTPERTSADSETVDSQGIRIQELLVETSQEQGRIPRTLDCELDADLVDSCVPGDVITVSGVVKVVSTEEGSNRKNKSAMFLLYLHVNSITSAKVGAAPGGGGECAADLINFTIRDLYAVQEIQKQENLFRLVIQSLCPAIYGHELVKAGLMLTLFGSAQKYAHDKNRIPVRGDPHILVVGDPGLGKSQMLHAVAAVAPRSVYVCGNTATAAGLTVTLVKEGSSGDYALEAGALILADQGCCCIDEFDKMGTDHQSLLEAMEQQSISIAKAGIVCTLPARASIIAAANPVGGHYNKAKTVSENLRMSSALLSRFDLIFILLDKPDEEMDQLLSEHVMALHSGKRMRKKRKSHPDERSELESVTTMGEQEQRPLSERLKMGPGEVLDPIPAKLLRKYIGYARKYVFPTLSPEACQELQNFYITLRERHQHVDSTPITTRQLESLIRLAEARARIELREVVTREDAMDAIEIMRHSLFDTYTDEMGNVDFGRSQMGAGMSKKNQVKAFVAELNKVAEQTYNTLFTLQQMKTVASDAGMRFDDFDGFVDTLNNQGYLLKKGARVYQLQSTTF